MIDKDWLAACATAGEFLYGNYSLAILKKMYERKKGATISVKNLISAMQELQQSGMILMEYAPCKLEDQDDDNGCFLPVECEGTPLEQAMRQADADGNPYASFHFDEDERMDLAAAIPEGMELDYYLPTAAEIEQLMEVGCIRTPEMTRLEEEIRRLGGDPAFLVSLWQQVSTDKLDQMESVKAILTGTFPAAEGSEKDRKQSGIVAAQGDVNTLMPFINEFFNNVNLRARKGWRPNDLFRKMHPNGLTSFPTIHPGSAMAAKYLKSAEPQLRAMGATVDYSGIDRFVTTGPYGERRMMKVGRNDPCPCGSGKKYKRCHGRFSK